MARRVGVIRRLADMESECRTPAAHSGHCRHPIGDGMNTPPQTKGAGGGSPRVLPLSTRVSFRATAVSKRESFKSAQHSPFGIGPRFGSARCRAEGMRGMGDDGIYRRWPGRREGRAPRHRPYGHGSLIHRRQASGDRIRGRIEGDRRLAAIPLPPENSRNPSLGATGRWPRYLERGDHVDSTGSRPKTQLTGRGLGNSVD